MRSRFLRVQRYLCPSSMRTETLICGVKVYKKVRLSMRRKLMIYLQMLTSGSLKDGFRHSRNRSSMPGYLEYILICESLILCKWDRSFDVLFLFLCRMTFIGGGRSCMYVPCASQIRMVLTSMHRQWVQVLAIRDEWVRFRDKFFGKHDSHSGTQRLSFPSWWKLSNSPLRTKTPKSFGRWMVWRLLLLEKTNIHNCPSTSV